MSKATDLPGFEVPLHRSLTEPILLGGAPRTVAIANGTQPPPSGWACNCGFPAWCSGSSATRWPYGVRASIRSSCRSSRGISNTARFWTCEGRTPC